MSLRDWLLLIFVGSIWGCSFLFNAVLIRELGPLWISSGRVAIAAVASWAFFFARRQPLPRDPSLYVKLGLLGLFSYALPFSLFPLGQSHIPSGLTAIINAMTPIMTVIVSNFWPGGERASRNKSLGVLAGFTGAALLAVPALTGADGAGSLWAIGVCFLATVVYATSLNLTRAFAAVEPSTIGAIALTGAALGSLPLAMLVEGTPHVERVETWLAWLALGLFSTALAFQIMYRLLPRMGATNFSANTFISPVVAIILGILLLNETILPIQFVGLAAIFLGLLLIDGRLFRRRNRAAAGTARPRVSRGQ